MLKRKYILLLPVYVYVIRRRSTTVQDHNRISKAQTIGPNKKIIKRDSQVSVGFFTLLIVLKRWATKAGFLAPPPPPSKKMLRRL